MFNDMQFKVLAIVPKVVGSLSIIGSAFVIYRVLSSQKKLGKVYHRLLLAMSIIEIIASFWFAMSTWPIPRDVQLIYGNVGNSTTCGVQAFFIVFSVSAFIYNGILAFYYFLVIRKKWKEHQLKQIEFWFHFIPICTGVAASIVCAAMDAFRQATLWCWIGKDNEVLRFVCTYGPLWLAAFFATGCQCLTYQAVRDQEKKTEKYEIGFYLNQKKQNSMSRDILKQALYYLLGFYFMLLPGTITRIIQVTNGKPILSLYVLVTISLPSQGVTNCLIYLRPRFNNYRKAHSDESFWEALRYFLRDTSNDDKKKIKERKQQHQEQRQEKRHLREEEKEEEKQDDQIHLEGKDRRLVYAEEESYTSSLRELGLLEESFQLSRPLGDIELEPNPVGSRE